MISNCINTIVYTHGTTNTADGLRFLYTNMFTLGNGDRQDAPNVAVVFTDGESNDPQATMQEAFKAKTNNIHIITVGIGSWVKNEELQGIASYPYTSNKISVDSYKGLYQISDMLHNLFCNSKSKRFYNNVTTLILVFFSKMIIIVVMLNA